MNIPKKTYLVFISFFLAILCPLDSFSDEKLNVAVIEFDVKGDLGIKDAGAIIAEWMISSIGKTDTFNLKERVLLKKVLNEQEFGTTEFIDHKTAAKIGKIYGVSGIITGSVLKWENVISVTVRLIDTETGSIIKTADVKTNDVGEIPNEIEGLAYIIAGKKIEEKVLNERRETLEEDGAIKIINLGTITYKEAPKTWNIKVPENYKTIEVAVYPYGRDVSNMYGGWNGWLKVNGRLVWEFLRFEEGTGGIIYDYIKEKQVLENSGHGSYCDITSLVNIGHNTISYYHYGAGAGMGVKIKIKK